MSPKVKICNKIRDFLPLDVLLPLNLALWYWEKIGNRKSEQKKKTTELELNASNQI